MIVLGLACEDGGHYLAVTTLVDAVLVRDVGWLVSDTVEHCREWRGYERGQPWSKCGRDDAPRAFEIDGRRVSLHGPIDGAPLKHGARMWREVLWRFTLLDPRPDVVVLAQDGDGRRHDRLGGLDQVRRAASLRWPFRIVVAMPEPEIEAWHVAGFEPGNEAEHATLARVRADLSFDPRIESHKLTSQPNDAATDAKRVLARLCGSDTDREAACLDDHDRLRDRGAANGAADFLAEVEELLVPCFGVPG